MYYFDNYGWYTSEVLQGRVTNITPPILSTTEIEGEDRANFTGIEWVVVPYKAPSPIPVEVPQSVTKRQGRQQMILMGLLSSVQAAIDSIPDETQRLLVQSFWDDSTQYERTHPQMLQLAQAIGLTDEQLDQAFIAASQL